jgi:hypothetical protein
MMRPVRLEDVSMVRLFVAFALLVSLAAPAFACQWNSAGNSQNTEQSARASHHGTAQDRS